ncbi:MgtC/SapB family protein [Terrimonas pollutisoli]|uniref:MgtC/SapB family protein n=1 Tax=Terrimonas pollutisoli TaxID=3034147 RepID=UPI0023EB2C56|nr:MgtC/SapB family protein [Terrimonas sp. H1YJ31]
MIDHWEILDLYKALLAVAAGMILGLERELKDKAAGLKTITVICLGSALFTILSYKIGGGDKEATRIASYVVSGIGFIGAGVIFKDKIDVSGLTTAGIIWLSAAVGMAIGFGEFYLAGTFIAAALFIVFSSKWINKVFRPRKQGRDLVFEMEKSNSHFRDEILAAIRDQGISVEEKRLELRDDKIIISVEASIRVKKLKWLEEYLVNNRHITAFSL